MNFDDADLYAFMSDPGPDPRPVKIAKDVGDVYRAFVREGFTTDQAFDHAREYFAVMLDVVEEAMEAPGDDDD